MAETISLALPGIMEIIKREAVIVAASRTAVGKSKKGGARYQRSDEMAAAVIRELLRQTEGMLSPEDIDDVIVGCAMPEGSQGMNTARVIALRAGLPVDVPAQTVNRFCSSGLQTIATAAERIIAGGAETIIAGGVETMSLVPMTGFRISPNPFMSAEQPEIYMNMGLTAERVAEKFGVSRQSQDEFAFRSHQRAAAATAAGKFKEEIVPVVFEEVSVGTNGNQKRREIAFEVDEQIPAASVESCLRSAAGDLLADLTLFDVFRGDPVGEGRRSLAFALRFQADDRTLTDAEVAEVRLRCIKAVEGDLGATLRS